jgi:hypothetical protein
MNSHERLKAGHGRCCGCDSLRPAVAQLITSEPERQPRHGRSLQRLETCMATKARAQRSGSGLPNVVEIEAE